MGLDSLLQEKFLFKTEMSAPSSSGVGHDLAKVYDMLVKLKVDKFTTELHEVAVKMRKTADSLSSLGEVKLPSILLVPNSPASETILAIHQFIHQAVTALHMQAALLSFKPKDTIPGKQDTASDGLDSSLQQLRLLVIQVFEAARKLVDCDRGTNTLRKSCSDMYSDIERLEKDAVLKKMGELSGMNCRLQSRNPYLEDNMLLNIMLDIKLVGREARTLVFEVGRQMFEIISLTYSTFSKLADELKLMEIVRNNKKNN